MRYLVILLFTFCGCSTINVISTLEIDTRENKAGKVIPHASFKVNFTPNGK